MSRSELTRQYLDLQNEASIAAQLGRYAVELEFDSLPEDVVHQAKRSLLDTLGCAIGAYEAPGREACESLVEQLGGTGEATVFGSGKRTNAPNAALANGFLVRYLDYNDLGGGAHGSDGIPSILATAEREGATGKEILTAVVLSYELGARFQDSVGDKGTLRQNGWSTDARAGVVMPPAIGKIMGLSETEIANAIGCCASRNLPLKILDAHREELTMTKNLRFGSVASDAIRTCILAQNGFTGPARVIEGEKGIREVLLDGEMDVETLVDFGEWRILETSHKTLCANGTTHGNVWATLTLVEEHDIEPHEVASVRIGVGERTYRHTASLSRKYPRNGETADHSAFYANAHAIKERSFGPNAFKEGKFSDPIILDLIERITVEPDPDVPEWGYQGISEIRTKDGEVYEKHMKETPGVEVPLTDEDVEEKFEEMAEKHMSSDRIRQIFDTVWNFEEEDDPSRLTDLMVWE